jgi:hypothetical protein
MNKINDVELLYEYFISHSHLDPTNTYTNNIAQNGTGVGNFLGGLIRTILPIIRKTSLALGSELVKNSVGKLNNELLQNNETKERKSSCTKRKLKQVMESINKKPRLTRAIPKPSKKEKSKKKSNGKNKNLVSSKKSVQSSRRSQRSKLSANKRTRKNSSEKDKPAKIRTLKSSRIIKKEKDIFSDL